MAKKIEPFRTINAAGAPLARFSTLAAAALVWNGSNDTVAVQELCCGLWEDVPTCELAAAIGCQRR